MKSIQDINLFNNDDSFNKNKENSINTLMNDHNIIKVLQEFNLSRRDIEENWIEFLDYKEDLDVCIGCKSLKSWKKFKLICKTRSKNCICGLYRSWENNYY